MYDDTLMSVFLPYLRSYSRSIFVENDGKFVRVSFYVWVKAVYIILYITRTRKTDCKEVEGGHEVVFHINYS